MAGQGMYRWRVRAVLPERFGQLCTLLVWGPKRAVLVEFADGQRYRTLGHYLRRADLETPLSEGLPA